MMDPNDNFTVKIRELEQRIQAENSTKHIPDLDLPPIPRHASTAAVPPLNFNLMSPSITRKKPRPCKFFLEWISPRISCGLLISRLTDWLIDWLIELVRVIYSLVYFFIAVLVNHSTVGPAMGRALTPDVTGEHSEPSLLGFRDSFRLTRQRRLELAGNTLPPGVYANAAISSAKGEDHKWDLSFCIRRHFLFIFWVSMSCIE